MRHESPRGLIPEIESLRGIAIALVFLLHADSWITWRQPGTPGIVVSPLRAFVVGGYAGVDLFFILSGFLLVRPFLIEAAGGKRVDRSAYYARRALRILPLYFVVVIAASVLCAQRPADVLRGVPYLLFLNSVAGVTMPLHPYSLVWWSLATEVQFYLLLPLLPFFLRSRTGRCLGAAVLAAYAGAYALFVTGWLRPRTIAGLTALGYSLFGRAPLFTFGACAAWLCERRAERVQAWGARTAWVRRGGADVMLLGVLVGLGFLLRQVVFLGSMKAETTWHAWHLIEGLLWTAVVLLSLLMPLRSKWMVSNRFLSTVGLLSYSIYLLHNPLIVGFLSVINRVGRQAFMGWSVRTIAVLPLLVVLCLGCSAVTYWAIERPFLRRKARLAWWVDGRRRRA